MADYTEIYKVIFDLSAEGGNVPSINVGGGGQMAGAGISQAQTGGLAGLAGGMFAGMSNITNIVNKVNVNVIKRTISKISYTNKVADATGGMLKKTLNDNKSLQGNVKVMLAQRNAYRDNLINVGEALNLDKGEMFSGNIYKKLNISKFKRRVEERRSIQAYIESQATGTYGAEVPIRSVGETKFILPFIKRVESTR